MVTTRKSIMFMIRRYGSLMEKAALADQRVCVEEGRRISKKAEELLEVIKETIYEAH